ncbi:uncharacterized protein ACA1_293590 [Acanthamoeba castellanii str. Neff]|jgi:hypothetical protein|uniref:Uncharacterized protein n=1 Tax=Acanthamoeba castellanii (strain ATCC 30010 / Neff) TaxID=1257118 RepID=L8HL55_ACACF|nr:uncharacterized protein ACA1_293590 [Acanthamoeba castellanii str. Neff]ELR25408.1 hypothetical protein ACA1_293590 [Acanthamoeba castellanii str. Neff]
MARSLGRDEAVGLTKVTGCVVSMLSGNHVALATRAPSTPSQSTGGELGQRRGAALRSTGSSASVASGVVVVVVNFS